MTRVNAPTAFGGAKQPGGRLLVQWPTGLDYPRWLLITDLVAVTAAAPSLLSPGKWTALGILMISVSWAVRWLATGRPSVATGLDLPIVLLTITAIVGMTVSAVPFESEREAFGIILGVAAFYALANCGVRGLRPHLTIMGVAGLGSAWALVVLFRTDWHVAAITPLPVLSAVYARLFAVANRLAALTPGLGPLFNPRQVGGVVSLALPPTIISLWLNRHGARSEPAALLVASVILAILAILSQSVSALAGLLIALWLAAILSGGRYRKWWLALGAATGGVSMAALWWVLGGPSSAAQRLAAASRPEPGLAHLAFGVESRLEIWQRALQMIHDMPYTGIGPGTFQSIMDNFYPGFLLGPEPHAHNILLQSGVDFGMPGLVAFVWLIGCFTLRLLAVSRHPASHPERISAIALGGGLAAYLIFGTIDVISLGSLPGLVLWIVLGLGAGLAHPIPLSRWERSWNWAFAVMMGVALVVPLSWDGVRLNAGRTFAHRGLLHESTQASQLSDLNRAAPYLEQAALSNAASPRSWYLLAADLAESGNDQRALVALKRGVQLDSQNPLPRYSPLRGSLRAQQGTDWLGLQRVVSRWMLRYPRRAEWYAAAVVISCERPAGGAQARTILAAAALAQAQPPGLLDATQSLLDSCPAAST